MDYCSSRSVVKLVGDWRPPAVTMTPLTTYNGRTGRKISLCGFCDFRVERRVVKSFNWDSTEEELL
jgi:hypothetical protein